VNDETICSDGLLPKLIEEWPCPPDLASKKDVTKAALTRIADIHAYNEIVWPAKIDGRLQAPPRSHIVDWAIREFVLSAADDRTRSMSLLRPTAMTAEVTSGALPTCGKCRLRPARYDTVIQPAEKGNWGYLCVVCYPRHGLGSLGVGRGRYLLTWTEIDESTVFAIKQAVAHWKAVGVSPPLDRPWEG